ncbi:hypothetical protein L596_018114 [Steinernema carpocapsae]|uniref:Uncharacterized protein n=1 Tax=Steinernema carpocapsae TaxID=34508 RepID=A0A4U5N451_STECR|nr:hypothetical protein L596_018114 [Steinernema carpocapsae]
MKPARKQASPDEDRQTGHAGNVLKRRIGTTRSRNSAERRWERDDQSAPRRVQGPLAERRRVYVQREFRKGRVQTRFYRCRGWEAAGFRKCGASVAGFSKRNVTKMGNVPRALSFCSASLEP